MSTPNGYESISIGNPCHIVGTYYEWELYTGIYHGTVCDIKC